MAALIQWDQIRSIEEYRKAIDRAIEPAPAKSPSIAILGAGISGLIACYELARKGYRVTLVEASSRIGGRILTSRYQGAHAELGAMRVPKAHIATRTYIEGVLELPVETFLNSSPNGLFHLREQTLFMRDIEALAKLFNLNDVQTMLLKQSPLALLVLPFRKTLDDLTSSEISDILTSRIRESTERVRQLDNQSIRDFLFQDSTTDNAAREWIANANHLKDIWSSPCTALLKEFLAGRGEGLKQICEGMDTLPQGIFDKCSPYIDNTCEFHTQTTVKRISNHLGHVSLALAKTGAAEADPNLVANREFEYVLCTLPFGVLKQMPVTGISHEKQSAIDRFRYAQSTKVLLNFNEKFWESLDDPIFGGSSVTDRIAGQIFYPTNPSALPNSLKTTTDQEYATATIPNGGSSWNHPISALPKPDPGVLIGSYAWGASAERLGALSHDARLEVVLDCLRDLHGRVVDETFAGSGASMAWGQHRFSAGAFGQPSPRDLQVFRNDAMSAEGRLYFSGEQLSSDPGWINGSINSTMSALTAMTEAITASS